MNADWLSCASANTTTAAADGTQAGGGGSMIFMIVILVVFFLVMIIPQKRRDKKIKQMLDAVKVGDRIRTIGGIYGTVVSVKEDLVTIETSSDKTKIVFAKGAISTVEAAEVEAADLQN